MEEQAIKGAGRLIDYGTLGIFALVLLAGFAFCLWLLKTNYEKQLKDKDVQLAKADAKIDALTKELHTLRDRVEGRLGDLLDSCGDAIHQNSIALHENAAVTNETKGVLLSIHKLIESKN
jgi:hypothetical protein